ncbi:unnamed protein product [Linum trigynum]|uniref:Phytoene synthase n=1 Tax=Linum trigynum TaxID=586398 RepID=A0AAV2G5D6_9ROSI
MPSCNFPASDRSAIDGQGETDDVDRRACLDVFPKAREVAISLYSKALKEIQAVPPDEGRRWTGRRSRRGWLRSCRGANWLV